MNTIKILFFSLTAFLTHSVSAQWSTIKVYQNVSVVFPCTAKEERGSTGTWTCTKNKCIYYASVNEYNKGFAPHKDKYVKKAERIAGFFKEYKVLSQDTVTAYGKECFKTEIEIIESDISYLRHCTIITVPLEKAAITFYVMTDKKDSPEVKRFFDSVKLE